jgi:acetate kinase
MMEIDRDARLMAKGLLDRIGLQNSELSHSVPGRDKYKVVNEVPDHQVGINLILKTLVDPDQGVIDSKEEIAAVGHRIVHGGEDFRDSVRITEEVIKVIEKCSELAPLHNPANLKGVYSINQVLPDVPQVVVFDTSFHQSMPPHAYFYPIPFEYYEKYRIRRYGFHGTSHKYVALKACHALGLDFTKTKLITCHLGNGSSIAAIKHGESVDTSMGFTPIEGLMMGTRCGDVDLGILLYIAEKEDLSIQATNGVFNKKSGVCGVSGISYDMRDVETAAMNGNERAQLSLDMYAYRVKKYIGAYASVLNGVDAIIFTGGIGENDYNTRKKVLENMDYLGIDFDHEKNDKLKGKEMVITKPGSKVTVMVMPTNEELVIAADTYNIISGKNFAY